MPNRSEAEHPLTGLEEAAALAALVRALALRAVEQPVTEPTPAQAIAWSWFRASRDGLAATIAYDGADTHRTGSQTRPPLTLPRLASHSRRVFARTPRPGA